jgi:hypothetical protein
MKYLQVAYISMFFSVAHISNLLHSLWLCSYVQIDLNEMYVYPGFLGFNLNLVFKVHKFLILNLKVCRFMLIYQQL